MNIKVGEYVRTKDEIIDKIDSFKKDLRNVDCCCFQSGRIYTVELCNDIILKHSKNIIDLIEVGDIVFIQDVLNNDFVYIYDDEMLKAVREDIEEGLQITKILTHQQFEQNCYKVKGE